MATSGTTIWNPDILELAEEAYERCGLILRGGYELRTAIRSINFLLREWALRGLNFWTLEEGELPLIVGQYEYDLPSDTLDLLMHHIRIQQPNGQPLDYNIFRVSEATYTNVVNKFMPGRPSQLMLHRGLTPSIKIWPVPERAYTLTYLRVRIMEDAGRATNTLDIPVKATEAFVSGLAYHIARKKPSDVPADRAMILKAEYAEAYELLAGEDVDRADYNIVPFKSWL